MSEFADFKHHIDLAEAENFIDNLLRLVPQSRWEKRAQQIREKWKELGDNTVLFRRHVLELHLADVIRSHTESGKYFGTKVSALDVELIQFALLASRLQQATSEQSVREAILKHLGKTQDLRPLRFELDTMSYGLQKGFDVEPADFNGSARYDFKMKRNNCIVAVECKHIDGDHGFPVKYDRAMELCDRIITAIKCDRARCGDMVIQINAKEAIDNVHALANSIADAVIAGVATEGSNGPDRFSVRKMQERETLSIINLRSRASDLEECESEVVRLLGLDDTGPLFLIDNGSQQIVIAFSTNRQSNPGEAVFLRLRDSAWKQLPEDMPCLLTVELAEFTPADMEHHVLNTSGSTLIALCRDLFDRRPHVAGIIVAPGHRTYQSGNPWGQTGRMAFVCPNRNHPSYDDPDFRVLV